MKWPELKKYLVNSPALSYLPFLCILPCLFSFYFLYAKVGKIKELEDKALFIQKKIEKKKQTYLQEEKIFSLLQTAQPNYIKDNLGSFSFLIPEQQKWKMFLAQLGSSKEIQEKYAFLETLDNRLTFAEISTQKTPMFIERELSQQKPIHLNIEDLKKVLQAIEGMENKPFTGAPQMVITEFYLEKTSFPEMQEKIYTLQMKLLTRQKDL